MMHGVPCTGEWCPQVGTSLAEAGVCAGQDRLYFPRVMEPILPTKTSGRQMDLLCTNIGRKENFSSRDWEKPSCLRVGFTPGRGFGLEGANFLQELLSVHGKGL